MQGLLLFMLWISIATSSYRSGSAVRKSPVMKVEKAREERDRKSYERSGPRMPVAVEPAPSRDMMSLVRSDDDPPTRVERDPLPEASSPIIKRKHKKIGEMTPEEREVYERREAQKDYKFEMWDLGVSACQAAARQTSETDDSNPPQMEVLGKLLRQAQYDWQEIGMDIVVPGSKGSRYWEEWKWFDAKKEEYLKQYSSGKDAALAAWNDKEFKKKVQRIIGMIGEAAEDRRFHWAKLWDGRKGLYPEEGAGRKGLRDGRKNLYSEVGTMMHNSVESKVATFGVEGDWNFTTFNAVCLTFGFLGFASSLYWYNRAQKNDKSYQALLGQEHSAI